MGNISGKYWNVVMAVTQRMSAQGKIDFFLKRNLRNKSSVTYLCAGLCFLPVFGMCYGIYDGVVDSRCFGYHSRNRVHIRRQHVSIPE